MPSIARVRSTASTIFFLPSLDRWDRPTAASLRASGVHPGRFAQGPDEKSGRAGRAFGFIINLSPLQKSCTPVGERGPPRLYERRELPSMCGLGAQFVVSADAWNIEHGAGLVVVVQHGMDCGR